MAKAASDLHQGEEYYWSNAENSVFLYSSHKKIFQETDWSVANCGLVHSHSGKVADAADDYLARCFFEKNPDQYVNLANQMIGDWSAAIFDNSSNSLTLINALTSTVAMYYYLGKGFLAFSTILKPLLVLKSVPKRVNKPLVSNLLLTDTVRTDETVFKDIKALRSGAKAVFEQNNGHFNLSLYSYERFKSSEHHKKNSTAQFRKEGIDLFKKTIEERLTREPNTGLSLSGGLDSASIAAFAAPFMSRSNKKLKTYTFVKLFDDFEVPNNWYKDEKKPVEDIAGFVGNIESRFNQSTQSHHIDIIEQLIDNGIVPPYQLISIPWVMDLMQMAKDDGLNQLIVGIMGNSTVSFRGFHARLNESWRSKLRYKLPAFLIEPFLNRGKEKVVEWQELSFLKPALFEKYLQSGYFEKSGLRVLKNTRIYPNKELRREMKLDSGRAIEFLKELSVVKGIHATDPTYDPRIVAFCLDAPQELFGSEEGNRLLIRKGMKGLLPDGVLNNQKRGRQVGDLFLRMRADAERIEEKFKEIQEFNLTHELLDIDRMKSFLDDLKRNKPRPILQCNAFLCALAIMKFLITYAPQSQLDN